MKPAVRQSTKRWTNPDDIINQLQRLWSTGRLLGECLEPTIEFPLSLSFRRPTARELSDNFGLARQWIRDLSEGSKSTKGYGYELTWTESDHRQLGRNRVPSGVIVPSLSDAHRALGKTADVRHFEGLCARTERHLTRLRSWLVENPFVALQNNDDWDRILAVLDWFITRPRSDLYIRQIDIPGVDTKFIETRRALLTSLLDCVLQEATIDHRFGGARNFELRFGLRSKPATVRFRFLDETLCMRGVTDLTVPMSEFTAATCPASRIFITENEINGLAFPMTEGSAVIFGMGYGIDLLAECRWLADRELFYWGDIDTHGFAMLDRLREAFPHTKSILMDRETLLVHRAFWSSEESQTKHEPVHVTERSNAATTERLKSGHAGVAIVA